MEIFFFQKALIVICLAMHICFGQQSYYYNSHATCVSTWMHVWGCQGLDRGLVPMWIKSRWRPWQGRKTLVSHILVFYSAFTSTLPMAAWHVQQGRLGFILECTVVCKTRKGTKPSALLCMLFLLINYLWEADDAGLHPGEKTSQMVPEWTHLWA